MILLLFLLFGGALVVGGLGELLRNAAATVAVGFALIILLNIFFKHIDKQKK